MPKLRSESADRSVSRKMRNYIGCFRVTPGIYRGEIIQAQRLSLKKCIELMIEILDPPFLGEKLLMWIPDGRIDPTRRKPIRLEVVLAKVLGHRPTRGVDASIKQFVNAVVLVKVGYSQKGNDGRLSLTNTETRKGPSDGVRITEIIAYYGRTICKVNSPCVGKWCQAVFQQWLHFDLDTLPHSQALRLMSRTPRDGKKKGTLPPSPTPPYVHGSVDPRKCMDSKGKPVKVEGVLVRGPERGRKSVPESTRSSSDMEGTERGGTP